MFVQILALTLNHSGYGPHCLKHGSWPSYNPKTIVAIEF